MKSQHTGFREDTLWLNEDANKATLQKQDDLEGCDVSQHLKCGFVSQSLKGQPTDFFGVHALYLKWKSISWNTLNRKCFLNSALERLKAEFLDLPLLHVLPKQILATTTAHYSNVRKKKKTHLKACPQLK